MRDEILHVLEIITLILAIETKKPHYQAKHKIQETCNRDKMRYVIAWNSDTQRRILQTEYIVQIINDKKQESSTTDILCSDHLRAKLSKLKTTQKRDMANLFYQGSCSRKCLYRRGPHIIKITYITNIYENVIFNCQEQRQPS